MRFADIAFAFARGGCTSDSAFGSDCKVDDVLKLKRVLDASPCGDATQSEEAIRKLAEGVAGAEMKQVDSMLTPWWSMQRSPSALAEEMSARSVGADSAMKAATAQVENLTSRLGALAPLMHKYISSVAASVKAFTVATRVCSLWKENHPF